MIPTYVIPYRDGELRIGWASWDDGRFKDRSIKYAYRDASGKISRGSPEVPFEILADMLMLAVAQGELKPTSRRPTVRDLDKANKAQLSDEKKRLTVALMTLDHLMMEFGWANWNQIYQQLGQRLQSVKSELENR